MPQFGDEPEDLKLSDKLMEDESAIPHDFSEWLGMWTKADGHYMKFEPRGNDFIGIEGRDKNCLGFTFMMTMIGPNSAKPAEQWPFDPSTFELRSGRLYEIKQNGQEIIWYRFVPINKVDEPAVTTTL